MGAVAVRHDLASAGLARRMLTQDLHRAGLSGSLVDDAVLVVSELVGNAVTHTAATSSSDLGVGWEVHHAAVLVWVTDASTELPAPRVADAEATSGRGLTIVAAVAADWGVEAVAGGKRVWARIVA